MVKSAGQFAAFAQKANALLRPRLSTPIVLQFQEFIEKARRLEPKPPPEVHLNEFKRFADASIPMAVASIKQSLPAITERVRLASKWLTDHDLLKLAGFRYVENSYTKLMAWALAETTHPPSALRRQRAWMISLGLDEAMCGQNPCLPET